MRIYKSWRNEDGSKETTLAPSLIELNLTQNGIGIGGMKMLYGGENCSLLAIGIEGG